MEKSEKYQGLPFLAQDEKDVYECGPEKPLTNTWVPPAPDASIEIIPTATLETFQRFQNSFMQSGFADADIRPSRESAVSKYNRLREEIEDLKEMLDEEPDSNVEIDIHELENNLSNLKLLTTGMQSSTMSSKMTAREIGSLIQSSNGGINDGNASKEQLIGASKVNAIEQRIKKLENFLGTDKQIGSFLNQNLKDESLLSLVVQLSNKATVLDHSSLDKVDARLNVVLDKLEQVAQKKDDLESLTKLNELYEHYVKTVDHNKRLPAILERLQVLSEVQRQAVNFTGTIDQFEQVQKSLQNSLETTRNNLKALKESLDSKSQSIEEIVMDLNARIEKLK